MAGMLALKVANMEHLPGETFALKQPDAVERRQLTWLLQLAMLLTKM